MAIYHLSVKTVSRSAGRSATAAAAYRAGEKIKDERTGQVHDYTRKGGVEHTQIFTPDNAPDWANNRESLWNAAEESERRKNSTVAREFEVALPNELSKEQRLELVQEFAAALVERHQIAVDVAIHQPSKEGDEKNHHAHVLCTTRRMDETGLTEKSRELDDKKTGEVDYWREKWAEMTNLHLDKAGRGERVDHRTLEAQGINREPGIHLGPTVVAMQRKGDPRGDEYARQKQERKAQDTQLKADVIELEKVRERIKELQQQEAQKQPAPAAELKQRLQDENVLDQWQKLIKERAEAIKTDAQKVLDGIDQRQADCDKEKAAHQATEPKPGLFGKLTGNFEKQMEEWQERGAELEQQAEQIKTDNQQARDILYKPEQKASEQLRKEQPELAEKAKQESLRQAEQKAREAAEQRQQKQQTRSRGRFER